MKISLIAAFLVVVGLTAFGQTANVSAQLADYCGNDVVDVPDTGYLFDFSVACMGHDTCYGTPGTEQDRRACDQAFLDAMLASCDAKWTSQIIRRSGCYSIAYTYFLAVRIGGWAFYDYL
jgi:hypothetical protein